MLMKLLMPMAVNGCQTAHLGVPLGGAVNGAASSALMRGACHASKSDNGDACM